jgi:hypothetical protein
MFKNAINFNQPLNFRRQAVGNECLTALCDTSNVTDMYCMFDNANKFNQPLNFDTKNVTNMGCMFLNASEFNQPLHFDTSNVSIMLLMFCNASKFNQPLNFDTSKLRNMTYMLLNATSFDQPVYFKSEYNYDEFKIFENTAIENKYCKNILKPSHYYKLILFTILNKINETLPFLCDEADEFIK